MATRAHRIVPFVIVQVMVVAPALAQQRGVTTQTRPSELVQFSDALHELADRVSSSVVQIFATVYDAREDPEGATTSVSGTARTSGAGTIVDSDGYVVTNAHLVTGAIRVQVELPSRGGRPGRSILRARGRVVGAQVVWLDEETDLAILKIAEHGLPALTLADSDTLRPGEVVLAFGSPFGLENSVTMGVVSAVARQIEPEDPMIYIQTDASINPGNSGGPLVDAAGRVVGINTFIYSHSGGSEGVGFAAPSNIVRNIFEQVRSTGRVRRGEIGVYAQTITPTLASGLELPQDWGVVLGDVYPGGAAHQAGLRTGDIVVSLDGKLMENGRQFQVNLYGRPIGEAVAVEIQRGKEKHTVRVKVIEREDDPGRFAFMARPEEHLIARLGILGLNLSPQVLDLLPELRQPGGIVVAAKTSGAPISREGELLPGDVIYTANRKPINSVSDLRTMVNALQPGDAVVLQVEREGLLTYLAFRVE